MRKRSLICLLLSLTLLLASVTAYASTTFDLILERFPNRFLEVKEVTEETTAEPTLPAETTPETAVETEPEADAKDTKGAEDATAEETLLPSETISGDESGETDVSGTEKPSETTTVKAEATTVKETTTNAPSTTEEATEANDPSEENFLKPFLSYLTEQFGEDAHVLPGAVTVSLEKERSNKPRYLLACSVITPTAGSVNASTSAVVLLCDLYNRLRRQEALNVSYSLAFTFDSALIEGSPYILSLTKDDYDGVILFDNLASCERLCLYKCNTAKDDPLYLSVRAAFLNNGTPLFEVPDLAYEMGFIEPLRTASLPVVMIESAVIIDTQEGLSQSSVRTSEYKSTLFTRHLQSISDAFKKSEGQISGTAFDTKEFLEKNMNEIYPVHAKNIAESLLRVSPREPMPVKEKPTVSPSSNSQEEGPTFFAPTTEEATTEEETTPATEEATTAAVKEDKSGMPFTRSFLFFVLLLFAVFAIALYLFRIRFILLRRRKTKFDEEEDPEDAGDAPSVEKK